MATDRALAGRRIVFISSDDTYTRLKNGDMGTILYERYDDIFGDETIRINWDSGSTLSLLRGRDSFKVLPEGEE
ncbi:DUF4314 domain-containing protein [archaeon]|jgi:hypothetical protein|nr:DUF4314 domain-containing protein [archaeon]|tara:strand:- start:33 stop:254 length:222 start_codon:yes stop_codon:yes gene_type:complete